MSDRLQKLFNKFFPQDVREPEPSPSGFDASVPQSVRESLVQRCGAYGPAYDEHPDRFLVVNTPYLSMEFDKIILFVIRCIDEGANLFIHSPLGTAKTHLIQQIIEYLTTNRPEMERILAFVMRQSLARSLGERLDLEVYLDEEHRGQLHNLYRLIISQESSSKLERGHGEWTLPHMGVWDEIGSNVANATSPTLNGKRIAYLDKKSTMLSARDCFNIFMDANVDDQLLKVLTTFCKDKPIYHLVNTHLLKIPIHLTPNLMNAWKFFKRDVEEFSQHWKDIAEVEDRKADKQIVMAFGSKDQLNAFKFHITKTFDFVKEADILMLTSESNDKDRKTTGNPTKDWAKYYIIMYTSSVLCGVNYDRSDLEVIVYVIASTTMSVKDGIQMAFRARNPKKIVFFTPPVDANKADLPTQYDDIVEAYHDMKASLTIDITDLVIVKSVREGMTRTFKALIDETAPETQIAIMKIIDRNSSRNNWAAHLIRYLVSISEKWNKDWNNPFNQRFRDDYLFPSKSTCNYYKKMNFCFLNGLIKSNESEKKEEETAIIEEISQTPFQQHVEKAKNDKLTIYSCKTRKEKLSDKIAKRYLEYGILHFHVSYKDILSEFNLVLGKTEYQSAFNFLTETYRANILEACKRYNKDKIIPPDQVDLVMGIISLCLYGMIAPSHVQRSFKQTAEGQVEEFVLNFPDDMIKAMCQSKSRWRGKEGKGDGIKYMPQFAICSSDLERNYQKVMNFLFCYQRLLGILGYPYPTQVVDTLALAVPLDDGSVSFPPLERDRAYRDRVDVVRKLIFSILKRSHLMIEAKSHRRRLRKGDRSNSDRPSIYYHPVAESTIHRLIINKIQRFRDQPEPPVGDIRRFDWERRDTELKELIKGWEFYPLYYSSPVSMDVDPVSDPMELSLSLDLLDEGSSP